jgi:hypothetical protein
MRESIPFSYQFDHTDLDVFIHDQYLAGDQSAGDISRPYLILCFERETSLVVGAFLSIDPPGKDTIPGLHSASALTEESKAKWKVPVIRRVTKRGIWYHGLTYWHDDLVAYLGQEVCVHAPLNQTLPASIEIFVSDKKICIAKPHS